jgi:hypothetical protein
MYSSSHSGYISTSISSSFVGSSRLEYIANSSSVNYSNSDTKSTSITYLASSIHQQSYSIGFTPHKFSTLNHSMNQQTSYVKQELSYYHIQPHQEYHFQPDNFLKPGRGTKFIGRAEEIKEEIEETFEKIFSLPFPDDIKISICDVDKFRKIAPNPSTVGLSINRRELGLLSEIFVLNESLGRIMLTIGHEIGHVLTKTLDNPHNEEAKAYAFSLLWMEVIQEHNIAGLGNALITESPAQNGLHNIAFRFVSKLIKGGEKVVDVYQDLIRKKLSISF